MGPNIIRYEVAPGTSVPFTVEGGEVILSATGGDGETYCSIGIETTVDRSQMFPIMPAATDPITRGGATGIIQLNMGYGQRYTFINETLSIITFAIWVI